MVQTRYKSLLRSLADDLPGELWLAIFDKLHNKDDLDSVTATSRAFRALAPHIWRGQCIQAWPDLVAELERKASTLQLGEDYWKSLHTLMRLRESDVSPVPASPTITERFRAIVVEWMMEVCMEWNLDHELDSNIVFHAVRYLDYCLETICDFLPQRLQLLGISCIRAALYTYRRTAASSNADVQRVVQQNLDINKAAYITNNACSDRDIRFTTSSVRKLLPTEMRSAPTPRTYLRWYWAWLTQRGAVTHAHSHIYDLAGYEAGLLLLQGDVVFGGLQTHNTTPLAPHQINRFFAQLSMLDQGCCGVAPSKIAAAALTAALRVTCPPDSMALALLVPCTAYSPEALQPLIKRMLDVQAQAPLTLMRATWVTRCLDAWGGQQPQPLTAPRRVVLAVITAPRRMKLAGCS